MLLCSDDMLQNHPIRIEGVKVQPKSCQRRGERLRVAASSDNSLPSIDLQQRKLPGQVELGVSPEGVSISWDGHWVAAVVEETHEIVMTDTAIHKQ
ncbi:MAG: hypothetical protein WCH44_18820 [Betaproteobacteria bacterium]